MAKNYTFAEAVRIINEGKDMESITDIGRRFPVLLHKVTKVATKAGDDFVDLMNFMPEHLTANKVNTALKAIVGETTETEDTDEVEEKDSNVKSVEKTTTGATTDYDSMTGKELWELLGKAGKRKDCKDKMGGAKKDDIIAYIKKYGLDNEEETVEEAETNEAETEEAVETNPYDGKSAMELFKECKKRGIKAEPKKPAKFYVDLLIKDDAANTAEETESESDDWDDEEEVNEEPKAKVKEKATKPAKPAKKEKEEPADEDDDWDI